MGGLGSGGETNHMSMLFTYRHSLSPLMYTSPYAVIYFFVVVPMNELMLFVKGPEEKKAPTKECPECCSKGIHMKARKCPFCISDFEYEIKVFIPSDVFDSCELIGR